MVEPATVPEGPQCSRCGLLPVRRGARRGGYCVSCQRATLRAWRAKNPGAVKASLAKSYAKHRDVRKEETRRYKAENKEKVREAHRRLRVAKRAVVVELKARPCVDCERVFPTECMDFDHLPGTTKNFGIALGAAQPRSMRTFMAEVAKCEVVCANCHQIRTHARRGGYRPRRETSLAASIAEFRNFPCADCRETFERVCMEFDHLPGNSKSFSVTNFRVYSRNRMPELLEELKKCELVCRNCHRTRTAKRAA